MLKNSEIIVSLYVFDAETNEECSTKNQNACGLYWENSIFAAALPRW
jgi:hypothetical protein